MIFCVEDDKNIRELVVYTLTATGFLAGGFSCFEQLKEELEGKKELPELILLDIMLPDKDGIEILKWLRQRERFCKIPVIMLTAKGAEYDKVVALDAGADDYVTKPFGMMELVSRIKAVLRRVEDVPDFEAKQTQNEAQSEILIEKRSRRVYVENEEVQMTKKEYDLLLMLCENPDAVLSRDQILERIWGYDFDGETRTVDVHVRSLRQKLGECGEYIDTVRGVGYRFSGRRRYI